MRLKPEMLLDGCEGCAEVVRRRGGKALLRLRIALVVIIVALAAVLLFLAPPGRMIAERAARAAPAQRGSPRVPHTLATGTTDHNVTTIEVDEQLTAAGAPRVISTVRLSVDGALSKVN